MLLKVTVCFIWSPVAETSSKEPEWEEGERNKKYSVAWLKILNLKSQSYILED